MLLVHKQRDHKETHTPFCKKLCTRVEHEVRVGVSVDNAMLFCQLTKWPHTGPRKHKLCDAVLQLTKWPHVRMWGSVLCRPVCLLVLINIIIINKYYLYITQRHNPTSLCKKRRLHAILHVLGHIAKSIKSWRRKKQAVDFVEDSEWVGFAKRLSVQYCCCLMTCKDGVLGNGMMKAIIGIHLPFSNLAWANLSQLSGFCVDLSGKSISSLANISWINCTPASCVP